MAKIKKIYIPVSEFRKSHPIGIVCSTDATYANIANELYIAMERYFDGWITPKHIRNVAIGLTGWLEDYCSNLHLWDVMMKNYCEFFGKQIPFYPETNDEHQRFVNDLRLALWLCVQAERDETIVNPENERLELLTTEIAMNWISKGYFTDEKLNNVDLFDYLYCEEVQTDIMQVKNVLMWIERKCYLGHWFVKEDSTAEEAKEVGMTLDQLKYGNNSVAAFASRTWPVSMLSKDIYADMIRMEMLDDKDEYAHEIASIEYKAMSMCLVQRWDKEHLWIEDFHGDVFLANRDSFQNLTDNNLKKNSNVLSAFVKFRGEWSSIGLSMWYEYKEKAWKDVCEDNLRKYELMHADGQYDYFIRKHRGKRLYFFKDSAEYRDWLINDLGLQPEGLQVPFNQNKLAVFFESNGQMTISELGDIINARDNKYYNREKALANAMAFVMSSEACSPDCLKYMIEKNYLKDARLKSTEGDSHGHILAQENLQFLACCLRRDLDWVR